jgi:hypothetical protein
MRGSPVLNDAVGASNRFVGGKCGDIVPPRNQKFAGAVDLAFRELSLNPISHV